MELNKELAKELEQRGTAEISSGVVNQVTQALSESDTEAEYMMFGELKRQGVIPIEEACAKCDFWKGKFETIKGCQEFQAPEAEARGFNKMICPKQLKEN